MWKFKKIDVGKFCACEDQIWCSALHFFSPCCILQVNALEKSGFLYVGKVNYDGTGTYFFL